MAEEFVELCPGCEKFVRALAAKIRLEARRRRAATAVWVPERMDIPLLAQAVDVESPVAHFSELFFGSAAQ